MGILKMCAVIVIIALTVSCSFSRNDYSGAWERDISDPDLKIKGNEVLVLAPDSSLEITNRLKMTYSDSNFNCRTEFMTIIKGKWSLVNNDIVIHLDTSSYIFDTIPGNTTLELIRNVETIHSEEARNLMKNDIISNLNELYHDSYTIGNVLYITHPCVSNDSILSGTCGEMPVMWYRKS